MSFPPIIYLDMIKDNKKGGLQICKPLPFEYGQYTHALIIMHFELNCNGRASNLFFSASYMTGNYSAKDSKEINELT